MSKEVPSNRHTRKSAESYVTTFRIAELRNAGLTEAQATNRVRRENLDGKLDAAIAEKTGSRNDGGPG